MEYGSFVPPGLRLDISYATGFVLEVGVYGAYTTLFVAALPTMTYARRLNDGRGARSAWVFLLATILMYLVATSHLICAAFRFYKSTILVVDPLGPISYLEGIDHWEFIVCIILLCIQTWLGDALVIYRCYYVWNNNAWLVAVPICLLLCCIGINSYVLWWIRHPLAVDPMFGRRLFNSIYPLEFAQNVMTTSLIVLKLWKQHRASLASGVVDRGTGLSLIRVLRIVIESAIIYTLQLLILVILYFREDNIQYVVQAAIVPSIGITFVLVAVRIQFSRQRQLKSDLGLSSTLSNWLHDPSSDIELSHLESHLPTRDSLHLEERKSQSHPDQVLTAWSASGIRESQKLVHLMEKAPTSSLP